MGDTHGFGFGDEPLADAIAAQLGGADGATVARLTAIAGLLARVAFADGKLQKQERELLGRQLDTLGGLSDGDRKVIRGALTINADTVTNEAATRYANTLRDQGDKGLCLEVLGKLVDLMLADGAVADDELWSIRELSNAMGLSAEDYDRALERAKR